MEKRINARMILVGMISLLLTAAMGIYVFHGVFDIQIREDVRKTGDMIARGYEYSGNREFLEEVAGRDETVRVTLISETGDVLFDSQTKGPLDNHLSRPEVQEALECGSGEEVRTSDTMGYDTYYYALLLEDGTVLRIAMEVDAMYSVYHQATPMLLAVGAVVFLLALFLSINLTRSLIRPITAMAESIDEIQEHIPYKELQPFADAVAQQRAQEKENQRIRQEFTANVSHELKTPLTSISGYAEMIEMGMARDEDVKEFASRIRTESHRLLDLIADIIRLGELDDAGRVREQELVSLKEVAKSVIDRLHWNARQNYVILKADLEDVEVWVDETMITEVCYNLCDNAIRYNRPGGTVWISVKRQGKEVKITVKDTGIGIPKEAQERVFERFYRVDKSRSKETGGTGLGLAIVKHAVVQMGGRIQLSSELGVGTEISVYLPMDPQNG